MKKTYAALALVVACVAATACTNPVQSSPQDVGTRPPARHDGGLVLGSGSRSDPGEGVEPTVSLSSVGTDPGGQLSEDGRGGLVLGSGSLAATSGID